MSGLTLTATALAGMVLGCAVVGGVGQVAVARARVDAAADLAALAAAARLARGDPADVACAAAAQVATAPAGGHPVVGGPVGGVPVGAGPGAGPGAGASAGPGAGPGAWADVGAGPTGVVECLVNGSEVTLRVAAPVRVLGLRASVEGRARAGPVLPG